MPGWRASASTCRQRASGGTQKTFSARYSSGSSGSAPWSVSASSAARRSSKASETYLRKISPSTTCLYSAASIAPRSASAMRHSSASQPRAAPPSSRTPRAMRVLPPRLARRGYTADPRLRYRPSVNGNAHCEPFSSENGRQPGPRVTGGGRGAVPLGGFEEGRERQDRRPAPPGQSHLKTGGALCEPIPRQIRQNGRGFGIFALLFELCLP